MTGFIVEDEIGAARRCERSANYRAHHPAGVSKSDSPRGAWRRTICAFIGASSKRHASKGNASCLARSV